MTRRVAVLFPSSIGSCEVVSSAVRSEKDHFTNPCLRKVLVLIFIRARTRSLRSLSFEGFEFLPIIAELYLPTPSKGIALAYTTHAYLSVNVLLLHRLDTYKK